MKPLFAWWSWLALWQRSQVVFVIIWTLLILSAACYFRSRFWEEHEDNLRLQQLYYHDTGRIIK